VTALLATGAYNSAKAFNVASVRGAGATEAAAAMSQVTHDSHGDVSVSWFRGICIVELNRIRVGAGKIISYDRWNSMPEKRAGMEKWDNFVTTLLAKNPMLVIAA
jgi:hypothetical protein